MQRIKFDLNKFMDSQERRLRETFDDNTAAIAGRLTRATIAEVFKYRYAATPWANGELITLDSSINPGATSVDWFGQADGGSPMSAFIANDGPIPFVDVRSEQNHNNVHTMATGFKYDAQEIASAEMAGLGSIVQDKGAAARRWFDQQLNGAILNGVTGAGMHGMLGIPGSHQMIAGTATGTTAAWATTATPEQIVGSMEAMFGAIDSVTTDTPVMPNTVVFPSTVAPRLRGQKSVATDTTIKAWLEEQFPEITLWKVDSRMNTAGLGSTAAVLMYNRDKDMVRAIMPLKLTPLPLHIKHQNFEQGFRARYGGIVCPFPKAVAVLSGV